MTIEQEVQKASTNAYIELFELDALNLGATQIFRFCNTGQVTFNGEIYMQFPIKIEGVSDTSAGAPNRPRLVVSNTTKFLNALITENGNLIGATFKFIPTFENLLVAGISAPVQVFTIYKLLSRNKTGISFELISQIDLDGEIFPPRQMLRESVNGANAYPGLGRNKNVG